MTNYEVFWANVTSNVVTASQPQAVVYEPKHVSQLSLLGSWVLEDKGDGYDEHNASLYQDSGFGGTVSTEKSASIKSSKSRMSKQSKMSTSEKSHSSVVTGMSAAATEDI